MNNTLVIGLVVVIGIVGIFALTQMNNDDMATDMSVATTTPENMESETMEEEGVMVGGAMMVPSMDIVENAMNANNVTTLVAAVAAADLVETLKGAGPFTVFAPTNAAFAALPAGTVDTLLLPENKADLAGILTYHVVAGAFTSADFSDGQTLTTVQGEVLTIRKNANGITINDSAMVETADVISSNGVTHVINAVLLPPTE
jgi:uncharacterized surface protein with fasciclin (FAS1) repeats